MKRQFVMLAVVLAAALWPAAAAYAAPPTYVHGTYTATVTVIDARYADGNLFLTTQVTTVISGDISGTTTGIQYTTVHADGSMNIRGSYTCNCAVLGVPVLTENRFEGDGVYGQWMSSTWQTVGGTGQGHGTLSRDYSQPMYEVEGWVQMP